MKPGLILLLQLCLVVAGAQQVKKAISNRIDEEQFVRINGIDQWVTIKGDSTKPVILFLHGGPGSPLSPYADAMFGNWEKDFTLVQWDQRGSGRTYGRNAPEELNPNYLRSNTLTIEQISNDGIELVKYLLKRLRKKKIVLIGTSWGSVPGVKMVTGHPELFYAYIGHSQIVDPSEALQFAYGKTYERAKNSGDQNSIDALSALGKPPYESARSLGQLMRLVKKAQEQSAVAAPAEWSEISPSYNNEIDNRHRSDGDDFSFVNYAGDKKLEVSPLYPTINLMHDGLHFRLPVYLVQGEEDLQTPGELTKKYFDRLRAPAKEYFLLPKTGHDFNQQVLDTQYDILTRLIIPLISPASQ